MGTIVKPGAAPRREALGVAFPSGQGTRPRPARRGDPRAQRTIDKILAAAIAVMLDRGVLKLACSDVCERAGVSRATFYRYYASKEALLEAVSLYIRQQTHRMLEESAAGAAHPTARWQALIDYPDTVVAEAARLLEKEPSFTLAFVQGGFEMFRARIADLLSPVFDAWEAELGGGLKRELIAELVIRYSVSQLVLPSTRPRSAVVAELTEMVALLRRRSE